MQGTKRTLAEVKGVIPDELAKFIQQDDAIFEQLSTSFLHSKRKYNAPLTAFIFKSVLHIQSREFKKGIPNFLIKIKKNQRYETYHYGVRCYLQFLNTLKLRHLNKWSIVDNIITELHLMQNDKKKKIILEHITAMAPAKIGFTIYRPEQILRAFNYLSSLALYSILFAHY